MSTSKWSIFPAIQVGSNGVVAGAKARAPRPGTYVVDVSFMSSQAPPSVSDRIAAVVSEARQELQASPEGQELQRLTQRLATLQGQATAARQSLAAAEAKKAAPGMAEADDLGKQLVLIDRDVTAAKSSLGEALAAIEFVQRAVGAAKARYLPVVNAALAAAGQRAAAANEERRLAALMKLAEVAEPVLDELALALEGYGAFGAAVTAAATAAGLYPT